MQDNIDWEKVNQIVGKGLYSGFAKFLMNLSHRNLAKFGKKRSAKGAKILEIGAGRGEHFLFVRNDFSEYVMSDVSDWGKVQIQEIIAKDSRVRFEIQDVQKIDFPDNSFDQVICSCVLIHVDQPFEALMEMRRVTKQGGVISIYLACDPGVLLRLMRFIVAAPKMKHLEVPYSLINALSHRNNVGGLIEMSKHVFKSSKISFTYYPFRIRSWNFSTHIILNIEKRV